MQIDPTKWPKVESRVAPEDGTYWVVYKDITVAKWRKKGQSLEYDCTESFRAYGPIEFVPPKVIPKKPHLELRLIETRHGEKWCLDWCDVWLPVGDLEKVRVMSYYKDECKDITPID